MLYNRSLLVTHFEYCCVYMCVSLIRTLVTRFRAALVIEDDFISKLLISLHMQSSFYQIRSHLQVLGFRTWSHLGTGVAILVIQFVNPRFRQYFALLSI